MGLPTSAAPKRGGDIFDRKPGLAAAEGTVKFLLLMLQAQSLDSEVMGRPAAVCIVLGAAQ